MRTWNPPDHIRLAFKDGLAVVHRKHKRRQRTFGPATALVDELFVIIDGQLEILAEGKWWPAPARAFACFRRGVFYGVRQKPGYDGPAQIVNVLFRAPREWDSGLPRRPLILSAPWWRKFMELESRCDFDATGQRVLRVEEITAFMERLAQAAALKGHDASNRSRRGRILREGPRRPDTGAEWMEIWARAEDVIRQRAGEGLSADELAEAVHVSPTQLRRVFQSARGIAPKTALTLWRIDEAKRLLTTGKWNATEVAEKVGFTTLQRFSAVFKEVTGESPSVFAQKL
jgi:AraC-like DNA-binding protein